MRCARYQNDHKRSLPLACELTSRCTMRLYIGGVSDPVDELLEALVPAGFEEVALPDVEEEEILSRSFTPAADELQPVQVEVEENVVLQTEPEALQEVPAAQEGNSLKKRIKDNPKEAIILAEILAPKFKEYN